MTVTALATFDVATTGAHPFGGVTLDAQGNLYGTTTGGGADNGGTVWMMAKGSNTITTLASFGPGQGSGSDGAVSTDAQGNLYGTTYAGGPGNAMGTVWELAKGSNTITTLLSFNGTNGANPIAGVTLDVQGNLFGTTVAGGASDIGTVWELASGASMVTTLATFTGANGQQPGGGITLDAHGNLYGTTQSSGANGDGTLFEIPAGTSVLNTLVNFSGTDGAGSCASLTMSATGQLYGTTLSGGANGDGTVFEFDTPAIATPEPSTLIPTIAVAAIGLGCVLKRRLCS
jgi:uncharacterized repeat protein (TIGR03803 family)